MRLLEMPLVIVRDVLEYAVATMGIREALRLRLVDRFFDGEVTRCLGRYKMMELQKAYRSCSRRRPFQRSRGPLMPCSFQLRLVLELINADQKEHNSLRSTIQQVSNELFRLLRSEANHDYDNILRAVCHVLLKARRHVFSVFVYELLQELPSPPNPEGVPDSLAQQVFAIAVAVPYPEIYERMVQAGFETGYITRHCGSPLGNAIFCGQKKSVEILLERLHTCPDNHPQMLREAFNQAAVRGNMEIFKLFLAPDRGLVTDPKACFKAAIRAVHYDNSELAALALEKFPAIPERERWALCERAAARGCETILLRCLSPEFARRHFSRLLVDATFRGTIPLSTVRLLLERGARVRQIVCFRKDTFIGAVFNGRVDLVDFFVQSGLVDLRYYQTRLEELIFPGPPNHSPIHPAYDVDFEALQYLEDHGMDFRTPYAIELFRRRLERAERDGWKDAANWFRSAIERAEIAQTDS